MSCQIFVHTNMMIVKRPVTSSISTVINTDVAFKAAQKKHMTHKPSSAREKFHAKAHFIEKPW